MSTPVSPTVAYHLRELEIARNPESVHYAMPDFGDDRTILDIGCGIGQTFSAARLDGDRLLIGIDVDLDSLAYGKQSEPTVSFVNATAEHLPFSDALFDLVVSRVSLPYSNVPASLVEIARVLKTNGRVWCTLHPVSMACDDLHDALRKLDAKEIIHRCYVLMNGLLFHATGRLFPFITRRYESFQTEAGMVRAMRRAGFAEAWVGTRNGHLVCTGRKLA